MPTRSLSWSWAKRQDSLKRAESGLQGDEASFVFFKSINGHARILAHISIRNQNVVLFGLLVSEGLWQKGP